MRRSLVLVAVGMGLGCSDAQSTPQPDAGVAEDAASPLRCGNDADLAIDGADPTRVVTDWAQVQRFNCARDAGQVLACTRDEDCPSGRLCDTSSQCGCCVLPPPELDSTQELHRALFTACQEGHCAAPSYCTLADTGGICSMTFSGQIAVWAMRYQSPANTCPLDDTRRQLCIKAESTQDCLWLLRLPGGTYRADAPFPADYSDSYECGGRTCNGADTFRVHPNAGVTFTAQLIVDNCTSMSR